MLRLQEYFSFHQQFRNPDILYDDFPDIRRALIEEESPFRKTKGHREGGLDTDPVDDAGCPIQSRGNIHTDHKLPGPIDCRF